MVSPPRPSRRQRGVGSRAPEARGRVEPDEPFSGGDGVIYTIDNDGDLYWRRHIGAGDGANTWSPPVKIGNGWDFTHVFAAGADASTPSTSSASTRPQASNSAATC